MAGLLLAINTSAWGEESRPEDLQTIFNRLLENPSDIALNFRYAEVAIQQDRLRNALAAYERILATDPNNEQAKAGVRRINDLLKPEFTALTLALGGQYESNAKLAPSSQSRDDDVSVQPYVQLIDERRLGGLRFRSEGEAFSNFYNQFTDLNFGKATVNTGPIFPLGDWNVRPGVGGGYAWLDGDTFYTEASALLNFSPATPGVLRRINTKFSYDWINDDISTKDAFSFEVMPQLAWVNTIAKQDTIFLSPSYRFNGTNGVGVPGIGFRRETFPLQSHQVGGRLDYYIPLFQDLAVDLNVTGYYQPYNESVTDGTDDRRDLYFAPGIQFIFKEVLFSRQDVVLGYLFENNRSNDSTHSYTNHIVSLRSVWSF